MEDLRIAFLVGGLVALAACTANPPLSTQPSTERIRAHIAFLADDALLGREPGTPGYDTAAAYVADQFRELGLQPAGDDDGYFQVVPLRRSVREPAQLQLQALDPDGRSLDLVEGADFVVAGSTKHARSDATAPVVFVGYGLVAPEQNRDDYAGLDVSGKIIAVLSGTPSGLQSEERAYYGSRKSVEASNRGAVGMIVLSTPASEKIYPFRRLIAEKRMDSARMGWIQDDGTTFTRAPNLRVSAQFSPSGSERLFAAAPTAWADVLAAAALDGGVTPTFDLPVTLAIAQASTISEIRSANVLGMIEGSDPVLREQVLVLSAHLDHIGVAKTVEPDRINNGALDNAAGVATLLEAARALMTGPRPKRSVLLLANTAEETGLLGAQYFAKRPTIDAARMIANINLDMPVLTYDFQDVIVFGGDRSTLRSAITEAAAEMSIGIGEDPFPEQGIFTRSDHFRFVEEGIPSVMLATGMANGGEAAWAEHFAKHYHRPSDELNDTINLAAAAKFAELKTRIALTVANAPQRPLWFKNDFFARQFNGPMLAE